MNNSSYGLVRLFFPLKNFYIVNSHRSRIHKTLNSTFFRLVSNTSFYDYNESVSKDKKTLNTFVSNLNQKGITKHTKNVLKNETPERLPDNLAYIKIPNKRNRKLNKSKSDDLCDIKISQYIDSEKEELIQTLLMYANVNRYPTLKMLNKLVASLVESRGLDAIRKLQQICIIAYPHKIEYHMNYQHYEAEILWKEGKYKESINLFEKLIFQYPKGRKKLCDMLKFLIRNLVKNNIEDELQFLICSVQRCAKEGIYHPAANFWQEAFVSNFTFHHHLAEELLNKNPEIKEFLVNKIDSMLAKAYEVNDIQILQRLVEALLALQITKEYSKVFSALLEFHCMANNFQGAKETFDYISKEKIFVTTGACYKYMQLLGSHKHQIPYSSLDMKYRISNMLTKFKF